MSEKPKTTRPNGTATIALKWIAGVAGSLLVIILVAAATAISSQGTRLAVVESEADGRDKTLARIEKLLIEVDKKVDALK